MDFESFMDEIVTEYSPDQEIHVILDNIALTKKWRVAVKKQKCPLPFYANVCQLVESSGNLVRHIFKKSSSGGASLTSPRKLRQRIEDFIECCNREVKGAQIKDKIENLSI
jgi:hypothetical protein